VITGSAVFAPLAEKYGLPFVVAGFEARQLNEAVQSCIHGGPGVRNFYPEAVSEAGNPKAKALLGAYFDLKDAVWRGLGILPASGYVLKEQYARWNALGENPAPEKDPGDLPAGCRCGEVILGRIDPPDCPLFGKVCTPLRATGPCMVSSEGACGIWYRNHA
jgi:hydrogenase expression/formation protein HypD